MTIVAGVDDWQAAYGVPPLRVASPRRQLVAPNTTAAAAGAWTSAKGEGTTTLVLPTKGYRQIQLILSLSANAVGNQIALLPLMTPDLFSSTFGQPPVATDDVWYMFADEDITPTKAANAGTVVTGSDFTLSPELGQFDTRGRVLRSQAALATSDEIRVAFKPLDLNGAQFVQVHYAETGVTGTPSTFGLWCAAII